jgi:hypothetical protein
MDDNLLEELVFPERSEHKKRYFEFLNEFRKYLTEFVRESSIDLTISQIEVDPVPQKLFFGEYDGLNVTLKNQGQVPVYLSTDRNGAYRLDPGEKEKFWMNKEVVILTQSGNSTLGFIRS